MTLCNYVCFIVACFLLLDQFQLKTISLETAFKKKTKTKKQQQKKHIMEVGGTMHLQAHRCHGRPLAVRKLPIPFRSSFSFSPSDWIYVLRLVEQTLLPGEICAAHLVLSSNRSRWEVWSDFCFVFNFDKMW